MGVYHSCVEKGFISEDEAKQIASKSFFSEKEVFILAKIFRNLTKEAQITIESFCKNLSIKNKSIGEILYKIIDSDGSGQIDFVEFVDGLNKFHPRAPFDEKVKMCFKAYDADGSGAVSKDEIQEVIKISIADNALIELENAQIDEIVDQLIDEYDDDGSGKLDYDEFYQMVSAAPGVIESFDIDLNTIFA
ncbi:EF hand family protein [Trichomonas vaginalis G3]|uniref:EF hand family protein n=1 Tax=Trichomonas vaginalis (strain ATCC PRA-98 / G3) TaxID=412133 RepID=A2FSG3_TRIV3|nr:oxidoreductase activity, acting on NAD(P)H, oxygen as acceptor [Trichomonas vaginalis G3]EAX92160.1 EF hand family protein [Trichomonas vaginalis G3]KAI5538938.1 oxidoreductase activity, acting on NAD(P)H, oxygen as acceptor [Trichomonas vaginalis G3]|eukprot:XP_001305090.1 EF hand family protein [Trichomonas vaginalis G3]